ncbi:GNAT family N-acetyltransferase [Proteinivorax hydrogeniformans]|uniref:GNAT family N-acetyltransferase n=1 Tax=Proteinivorax hydrogeniformans TaxID=1826727 RepID=A0AAU8HTK2_9FIRM
MEINFRPINKEHIEELWKLSLELKEEKAGVSFVSLNSKEDIEKMLDDQDIYLYGAFQDKVMIGAFSARRGKENKKHSCHIAAAFTKACRGKGISQKLMDYALADLKKEGIWMIRAYVYSHNKASVGSLLSCGFTWAGTVHKHQWNEEEGRYIDDLIFHKDLSCQ